MGAALAALLGIGGGSAMAYAGEQHAADQRAKEEARQFTNQSFLTHLEQHPEMIDNPDIDKQGQKLFGKAWDIMSPQYKVLGAQRKRHLAALVKQYQMMPGGASIAASLQADQAGASDNAQSPTPALLQ